MENERRLMDVAPGLLMEWQAHDTGADGERGGDLFQIIGGILAKSLVSEVRLHVQASMLERNVPGVGTLSKVEKKSDVGHLKVEVSWFFHVSCVW